MHGLLAPSFVPEVALLIANSAPTTCPPTRPSAARRNSYISSRHSASTYSSRPPPSRPPERRFQSRKPKRSCAIKAPRSAARGQHNAHPTPHPFPSRWNADHVGRGKQTRRFRVSPLEAGDYEIEAFDGVNVPARGSGPSGATIAVPREGIVSAEAVVDRRATLEGRVVDAGGAPVKASVRVACESTGAERDLRRMAVLLGAGVKRGPVETGPDGHFAIGGVARDARCTVHAQAATAAGSTPEVRPGEQAVITVKPASSASMIIRVTGARTPTWTAVFRPQTPGPSAVPGFTSWRRR